MSYMSLARCSTDAALLDRVTAAGQQEARTSPRDGDPFAETLITDPSAAWRFMWPVSIDNEAAYESALAASNPDPGGDPSVITDGNILAAVQAHWPAEPVG